MFAPVSMVDIAVKIKSLLMMSDISRGVERMNKYGALITLLVICIFLKSM